MLKSLKFWLIVSLCMNLLLIGLFAGEAYHHKSNIASRLPRDEIGLILRAMPHETRREFGGALRDHISKKMPRRGYPPAGKLADWIGAQPYDPAPIADFFASGRAQNANMAGVAHERLLAVIANMSDEERAQLADQIRKMGERRMGEKGKKNCNKRHK